MTFEAYVLRRLFYHKLNIGNNSGRVNVQNETLAPWNILYTFPGVIRPFSSASWIMLSAILSKLYPRISVRVC